MTHQPPIVAEFIPRLVSVIFPVYKREHLIAETLDSILAQTYREFEIVAINDGSKDGSALILNRYAAQHPGVFRIIDQENTGQVVARNNGIKQARGEYIAFPDSDDRWVPEKLEEQVPLFDQLDVGLVYSGITKIDELGQPFQESIDFWMAIFDVLEDYPLGFGIQGFVELSPNYLPEHYFEYRKTGKVTHSTWFHVLSEIGWLGLFFLLPLFVSTFTISRKNKRYLISVKNYDAYFKILALEGTLLSFLVAVSFIVSVRSEILYSSILSIAIERIDE